MVLQRSRYGESDGFAMDMTSRKQLRLPEYDYSTPGAYFVTICTHDRQCILSDIIVGALHEAPAVTLHLTEIGKIVAQYIEMLPVRYPNLEVAQYVIMPNHIHLLLHIGGERALREAPLQSRGGRSLLAQAIGFLKMNSSKQVHMTYPTLALWQRSFHEHVIRGERDYREIWEYMDENPAKWAEDRYYAQ